MMNENIAETNMLRHYALIGINERRQLEDAAVAAAGHIPVSHEVTGQSLALQYPFANLIG